MDVSDAGLIAAAMAVALASVKALGAAIDALRRRANDGNGNTALEVARQQLIVMQDVEKGVRDIHGDNRVAAKEIGHLQRSVDKLHTRLDQALGER